MDTHSDRARQQSHRAINKHKQRIHTHPHTIPEHSKHTNTEHARALSAIVQKNPPAKSTYSTYTHVKQGNMRKRPGFLRKLSVMSGGKSKTHKKSSTRSTKETPVGSDGPGPRGGGGQSGTRDNGPGFQWRGRGGRDKEGLANVYGKLAPELIFSNHELRCQIFRTEYTKSSQTKYRYQ